MGLGLSGTHAVLVRTLAARTPPRFDPARRITAAASLQHRYFTDDPPPQAPIGRPTGQRAEQPSDMGVCAVFESLSNGTALDASATLSVWTRERERERARARARARPGDPSATCEEPHQMPTWKEHRNTMANPRRAGPERAVRNNTRGSQMLSFPVFPQCFPAFRCSY